MSEYQFYDFRAIDRPLTRNEMDALRAISTRAEITSTSFTNHYEWGDLKANPGKLLEKYFDAFLYVANWGTREFCIRLPQGAVDYERLSSTGRGEFVSVRKVAKFVVVEFGNEAEWEGDEDDGTGWMASLATLRSELLSGDLRCLYLGWLRCAQGKEFREDKLEPPVPAGLGELSASLQALTEFLGIDEDLIEIAAQASAPLAVGPNRKELSIWIRGLPEKDKNEFLVAAVAEPGERWRNDLLRRFQFQNAQHISRIPSATTRRTVGYLLGAVHACEKERAQRLNSRRAAEAAQRKAEDEVARARYLDQLGRCEPEVWKRIAAHIQTRQPKNYDNAVILLTDLHDVAVRRDHLVAFQSTLENIRQAHAAKESFLRRLTKANLSGNG